MFMVVSFIHSVYPISEQKPNLQIPHNVTKEWGVMIWSYDSTPILALNRQNFQKDLPKNGDATSQL